jgi:hypothetical protein
VPFFYSGGLVLVKDDDAILDCYRLAKEYAIDPDIFLDKPLSTIRRHMSWTARLKELQRQQDDEE